MIVSRSRRPRSASGFSLIEVLVALVLLGMVLLMGMQLMVQGPRIVRRTDAERQAFRALESVLEGVRAGAFPMGDLDIEVLKKAVGEPAPDDLEMFMRTEALEPAGLYRVTLTATYTAVGEKKSNSVQTLVWSP